MATRPRSGLPWQRVGFRLISLRLTRFLPRLRTWPPKLLLFQDNSAEQATADDPYTGSPEIWKNMDDFKARLAKLGSEAKAAASSVKDLESFKAHSAILGRMIAAVATRSIG